MSETEMRSGLRHACVSVDPGEEWIRHVERSARLKTTNYINIAQEKNAPWVIAQLCSIAEEDILIIADDLELFATYQTVDAFLKVIRREGRVKMIYTHEHATEEIKRHAIVQKIEEEFKKISPTTFQVLGTEALKAEFQPKRSIFIAIDEIGIMTYIPDSEVGERWHFSFNSKEQNQEIRKLGWNMPTVPIL